MLDELAAKILDALQRDNLVGYRGGQVGKDAAHDIILFTLQHVGMAAPGVGAAAGLGDVYRQQRQGDQAAGGVGPV